MKQRIIGVTESQRQFRVVFDKVAKKGIPYILTRGSRPEAVLIPYEEYLRYQALNEPNEQKRFDLLMKRMQTQTKMFQMKRSMRMLKPPSRKSAQSGAYNGRQIQNKRAEYYYEGCD